jgi:hypothetical protein
MDCRIKSGNDGSLTQQIEDRAGCARNHKCR